MWKIGIYSNYDFWHNKLGNTQDFSELPLWFAHPDGVPNFDDYESLKIGGWELPHTKQFAFDEHLINASLTADLNVRYQ